MIPQHITYAVYDKETEKMMEMSECRNHPNQTIRKEQDRSVLNEYGQLMKGIQMKRESKSQVQGFDTFTLHTQKPNSKR